MTTSPTDDLRCMSAALALGRRGLGRTSPNPSVGALIVKDGRIVGRGVTAPGGRPHGETLAIAQAGPEARGGTLYVTLEPCSHHGRTPPCCEAVVAAGLSRVVYAIEDPNPDVAGRGAAFCRQHGLEVIGGVGTAAARHDHLGHIRMMREQRPMLTLKLAETADGFVAGGPYDPRLSITGMAANGMVHVLRALHDAIMVGIGTVLADDPLMTVRLPGVDAKPLRVVLDPLAQTSPNSRLVQTAADGPVLLLIGEEAPPQRIETLAADSRLDLLVVSGRGAQLDLAEALRALGQRGIRRVFCEGGPTVAEALIRADLVDEALIFTAPRPLAAEGVPAMTAATRAVLNDPARFHLGPTDEIGVDRLRRYESLR